MEAHRNEKGEYQLTDTGDSLIDKWEQQIADGKVPDLFEAFDEESIQHMERLRQAARDRDPYQGMSMKDNFEAVQRQAAREGLSVGRQAPTEQLSADKRRILEDLLNTPTFGGHLDD